jgi:hypothetical protein
MCVEDVRRVGWQPYTPAQYVEWCGHGQEVIPMPGPGGCCTPVEDEGRKTRWLGQMKLKGGP